MGRIYAEAVKTSRVRGSAVTMWRNVSKNRLGFLRRLKRNSISVRSDGRRNGDGMGGKERKVRGGRERERERGGFGRAALEAAFGKRSSCAFIINFVMIPH